MGKNGTPRSGSLRVSHSTFTRNAVRPEKGIRHGRGGAIHVRSVNFTVEFSTFTSNVADNGTRCVGGGFHKCRKNACEGGGIYIDAAASPTATPFPFVSLRQVNFTGPHLGPPRLFGAGPIPAQRPEKLGEPPASVPYARSRPRRRMTILMCPFRPKQCHQLVGTFHSMGLLLVGPTNTSNDLAAVKGSPCPHPWILCVRYSVLCSDPGSHMPNALTLEAKCASAMSLQDVWYEGCGRRLKEGEGKSKSKRLACDYSDKVTVKASGGSGSPLPPWGCRSNRVAAACGAGTVCRDGNEGRFLYSTHCVQADRNTCGEGRYLPGTSAQLPCAICPDGTQPAAARVVLRELGGEAPLHFGVIGANADQTAITKLAVSSPRSI